MVGNNSTIINKANNHVVPKLIEHKKTTTYGGENPDQGLRQTYICGGVKPDNGIPTQDSIEDGVIVEEMISKVWRYQRGNDCFILNHQTMCWNYIAQAQWKNSYLIDMWSYSDRNSICSYSLIPWRRIFNQNQINIFWVYPNMNRTQDLPHPRRVRNPPAIHPLNLFMYHIHISSWRDCKYVPCGKWISRPLWINTTSTYRGTHCFKGSDFRHKMCILGVPYQKCIWINLNNKSFILYDYHNSVCLFVD